MTDAPTALLESKAQLARGASLGLAFAIAIAATASPALAHHSASMFDMTKSVDVKGAVKEFHWTNPHSWLVLEARDSAGMPIVMNFEANGPGYLVRNGWKNDTLKPGDAITVTANPLRDGTPGGNIVKVTLADGRELSARPNRPPTPGAAPAAPGTAPSARQ